MIEPVLPCYMGEGLTQYGATVAAHVVAHVGVQLVLATFVACFAGAWLGRAAFDFFHIFVLRRSPRWRRFQRALSRVFA